MSTFYAVHFAPGSPLIEDAEVVDELPHGWALLDSAIALWRLVDSGRANAIEAFVLRVAEANETYTQFAGDDLAKLIELTAGSEVAIRAAGIIDANGRGPPERLDELKRKVPAMDLEIKRSLEKKTNALMEVIWDVDGLRDFLATALSAGCTVVHS